jgi:hypothetical protein
MGLFDLRQGRGDPAKVEIVGRAGRDGDEVKSLTSRSKPPDTAEP